MITVNAFWMMYDVRDMMYNAWCTMYDVWRMLHAVVSHMIHVGWAIWHDIHKL